MNSTLATNEAVGLNQQLEEIFRVGNTKIISTLENITNVNILILDGIITQRLLDKAAEKNITEIYAINKAKNLKTPNKQIKMRLFRDYLS